MLIDRIHYYWSKDAETNDIKLMRSVHKYVMTNFEIPEKIKKKTRHNKATPVEMKGDEKKKKELRIKHMKTDLI